MPERCSDDCPCAYCEDFNDNEAWCEATKDMKAISFLDVHRPDWCPLVEVTIDYDELLKVAKAMHTWIFLNSVDEQEVYDECGLTDEMNAFLGYAGSFTVIPADKDGET